MRTSLGSLIAQGWETDHLLGAAQRATIALGDGRAAVIFSLPRTAGQIQWDWRPPRMVQIGTENVFKCSPK